MDNLISLGFLFIPLVLLSFLITLVVTPNWIKKAKKINLVWDDVHKLNKREKIAGSGGIALLIAFSISVLLYIGIKTFIFKTTDNVIEILTLLITIVLAAFVGFVDDLLGWKSGGLSKRSRLVMMFFIAIPLMIINAGQSTMLGINFGILYPLILIPLGIVGAGTTFNFLAGYNGLEVSQGILVLASLSIVSFIEGNFWLCMVSCLMISSLLALWLFNKYPSKVFVGDITTYSIGVMIACMAIFGNMEKIAVFFFIPYILEVLLKARGKFKKQSFSKLNKDGSLDLLYGKVYGLEHLAVLFLKKIKPSKKAYEWEVPIVINIFQLIIIILGFIFLI